MNYTFTYIRVNLFKCFGKIKKIQRFENSLKMVVVMMMMMMMMMMMILMKCKSPTFNKQNLNLGRTCV